MEWNYYFERINKNTIQRYDITPLFENPEVFSNLIEDMLKSFKNTDFDKIVGIDALGFILAGALALKTKKPLIVARKEGKLPSKPENVLKVKFTDYTETEKAFEMNKGAIEKGDKVLIVDEWIETGGQVKAAIELVERQGGEVVGITTLGAEKNHKTKVLFDKYRCRPIQVL